MIDPFKDAIRDDADADAVSVFIAAYQAQGERLEQALSELTDIEIGALEAFWIAEPANVRLAVSNFYNQTAQSIARAGIGRLGDIKVDWSQINTAALRVARERVVWFAETMTKTSRGMSADVIRAWIAEPTTFDELIERLRHVFEGSRPDVAATTEVTAIFAEAQIEAWAESGVVDGYNVVTANDERVRASHTEVAKNGPYPLTDTVHRPPLDINCRCDVSPVVRLS